MHKAMRPRARPCSRTSVRPAIRRRPASKTSVHRWPVSWAAHAAWLQFYAPNGECQLGVGRQDAVRVSDLVDPERSRRGGRPAKRGDCHMEASAITARAALLGAAIGGLTSLEIGRAHV